MEARRLERNSPPVSATVTPGLSVMTGLFVLPACRVTSQETTHSITVLARSLPFVKIANVSKNLREVQTIRCLFRSSVSALVRIFFLSDKCVATYHGEARRNAC